MHTHSLALAQIAILVVIVAIIFSNRRHLRFPGQLGQELLGRFLVYSAETTRGKEAEFIRERLPRKISTTTLIVLISLGVFGAVAWLLMR